MFHRDRIVLFFSLLCLAGAGLYWSLAGPAEPEEQGGFVVRPIPPPALSQAVPHPDAGFIRFTPDPVEGHAASVHGIAGAIFYPVVDGLPDIMSGQNVVATQSGASLPTKGWMRDRRPGRIGDEWLLHFALWCAVEGRDAPVWWTGWAAISLSQLTLQGIDVRPEVGDPLRVFVQTTDGSPIPGAAVSVDPAYRQPGSALQMAATGADGSVVLFGLDAARDWILSLPDGAGPSRKPVRELWTAGTESEVRLIVALPGEWESGPLQILPPFLGANLRVEGMKNAWPAAKWLPAGRVPTPCYALWPAGRRPETIKLKLAGFPAHEYVPAKNVALELRAAPRKRGS